MPLDHQDQFVVYVRADRRHPARPESSERVVFACASYADARRVRAGLQRRSRDCVIRFVGATGGGD